METAALFIEWFRALAYLGAAALMFSASLFVLRHATK